jgi:hypothetical protein
VSKAYESGLALTSGGHPEEALRADNPDYVERIFLGPQDYLKTGIRYSNQISHTVYSFLRLLFPFCFFSVVSLTTPCRIDANDWPYCLLHLEISENENKFGKT